MDGTLMDPNGSIRVAIDGAVESAGFAAFEDDEVLIGMPLREILQKRTTDPELVEAMVEAFRRITLEEAWRLAAWYPGLKEAVAWCRDRGLKTGVVTTKGQLEADTLLARRQEAHLFDAVVGDDDVRPVKPNPAPVLEALRQLNVPATEAVMIGDTSFDVDAGRAAGCATIGVNWGHGSGGYGPEAADFVVNSPESLIEALSSLLEGHNA